MKRTGYIYEKLITEENCRQAIKNACKHRHNIWIKKEMKYVRDVLSNMDECVTNLSKSIQELNFCHPYRIAHIKDRCSKKDRELKMSKFYTDQCAFHAIKIIYEPIVLKGSYYWSCANLKGRGIKRAYKGTVRGVEKYNYCLEMDIKGFYGNIDNELLKSVIDSKIKDTKFKAVLFYVIDQTIGQPIGNVLSPLNAELFLQELDTELCKIKGIFHIRYADDFRIFCNNKRKLHKVARFVIKYLNEERHLTIKPNWQVYKINSKTKEEVRNNARKVDFIGYCFSKDYTTIRKRRSLSIMRQARLIDRLYGRNAELTVRVCQSHMSRASAYKFSNSFQMERKYEHHIKELKEIIRRNSKCGIKQNQTLDQMMYPTLMESTGLEETLKK